MRRRKALAHGVVSVVSAVCLELRTEGGSVPSLVAFRRGDSKAGGIAILGPELARETTTRPGLYDQRPRLPATPRSLKPAADAQDALALIF